MSNILIPKEQLSAYERWELASFGEATTARVASAAEKKSGELAEGLAKITEKARQEGYAAGLEQGYTEGMKRALEEHGVMQQAISHIAESLQASLLAEHEQISHDLLNLALDIAKGMLKATLSVNHDVVVPVVKNAIASLPYVVQPAKLILHPADATIIRQQLDEEISDGWTIIESMEIERGGCMIETAANQVDASNATRWKRIGEALGSHADWGSIHHD